MIFALLGMSVVMLFIFVAVVAWLADNECEYNGHAVPGLLSAAGVILSATATASLAVHAILGVPL